MTINSTSRKAGPFIGTGAQTAFAFLFKIFLSTDLRVVLTDATGVEVDQVLNVAYTVVINADQESTPGGTVTMLAAPAVGAKLTITSVVPITQGQSIPNNSGFYPKIIENAYDRLTIVCQQLAEQLARSIKFGISDTTTGNNLPAAAQRANNLLGFDGSGNMIAVAPIAGTATALQSSLGASAGAGLVGFSLGVIGAITRTLQERLRDSFNVKDFGAKGDGAADDTNAIVNADTAARLAGKELLFPSGVYMASQLPIKSGCRWVGAGRDKTTLRQIIGSNRDFLLGDNSAANWGNSFATTYVDGYGLEGLTVDGNWNAGAGNTSGTGLAVWGSRPILRDVFITNCAEHGYRSEWSDVGPLRYGMEGHIDNIRIDTVGKHGWWNNGPHDSVASDVIVIDASQAATNTYDGILLDTKSNIRGFGLHSWNRTASARHRFAINDQGGGNEICASHFEGAYSANVNAAGPFSSFEGCNMYAAWNGINAIIRNTGITIRGKLGAPGAGRPACKGVVLGMAGDNASSCLVDVVAFNQNAGVIDFTNEPGSGFNTIRVRGYSDAGAVFYVGAPSTQDNTDIGVSIAGAPNVFRQASGTVFQRADIRFSVGGAAIVDTVSGGVTAAGATQGTAFALAPNTIHPVNTVAAGTGVLLPDSTSFLQGKSCMVCNFGANPLLVYPEVGGQLGTLGTNSPVTVAVGKKAHFTRTTASQWAYMLSN